MTERAKLDRLAVLYGRHLETVGEVVALYEHVRVTSPALHGRLVEWIARGGDESSLDADLARLGESHDLTDEEVEAFAKVTLARITALSKFIRATRRLLRWEAN
jgi:hypothetical protein